MVIGHGATITDRGEDLWLELGDLIEVPKYTRKTPLDPHIYIT